MSNRFQQAPKSKVAMASMSDRALANATFGYEIDQSTMDRGNSQITDIKNYRRDNATARQHYAPSSLHGKQFITEDSDEMDFTKGRESMAKMMNDRNQRSTKMQEDAEYLKTNNPELFKQKYCWEVGLLYGNDDNGTLNDDVYQKMRDIMAANQETPGTFLNGNLETDESFLSDDHTGSSQHAIDLMNRKMPVAPKPVGIKPREFVISPGAEMTIPTFSKIGKIDVEIVSETEDKCGLIITKKGKTSKTYTLPITHNKSIAGMNLTYFENTDGCTNVTLKINNSDIKYVQLRFNFR